MKFLYPQVLWALTLLLIPIIIHLFNFKRYKTLYFSSLNFIKKVDQEAKSTKQLKRYLILASRLLALTALILAFAQPYWNNGESAISASQPIFIHIDNSFSMQAQGQEGQLLSMAKEKARDLIEAAPNDQLFVISTHALNGREERLLKKADAFEKIDHIDYTSVTKPNHQIQNWQQQVIAKLDNEGDWKRVKSYFFSDFQRVNGSKEWNKETELRFKPVWLKAENTDNLLIDSLWFDEPINRLGKSNRLNFRVSNQSNEDLSNVEVEFQGEAENKIVFVDLPARSKTTSAISISNSKVGLKAGSLKVADQNIYFDDQLFYAYTTEKRVNVLILNGEDASANVGIIFDLDSYYAVLEKEFNAFKREDLEQKDLIILNGVNALPSGSAQLLSDAFESGSSVALFPGTKPNKSDWNSFLGVNQLPQIASAVSSGTKLKKINYDDPFFQHVFDKESDKLNLPLVNKVFSAPGSGSASNTILGLSNGLPLFVSREGAGKYFVFYSSLSPEFGAFAKDALCSTIFLRMGELSKRQQPLYIELGSTASFPVYTELNSENPVHLKTNELDLIPFQNTINGVTRLQLNQLNGIDELVAGNYALFSENREVGKASLNYSRGESQLQYLSTEEIEQQFGGALQEIQIHEMSSTKQFDPSVEDRGTGIWRFFILLTLIFVICEMLLIRFLK